MAIKTIYSRAPTRIDLAGGTVDIWPLYLFLDQPLTLNLGIDLYAEAKLELSPLSTSHSSRSHVFLKSEDQNLELQIPWDWLEAGTPGVTIPPGLDLHYRLLKYFFEKRGKKSHSYADLNLALTTRARSPAGAGLGGSSTLSIAMIGAISVWEKGLAEKPSRKGGKRVNGKKSENRLDLFDPETEGESFIEIVRDVETTVIRVPAGLQDYYGAMFGGLQSLRWGAGTHHREWLPNDLIPELEKRLLLFYSGQSRNSGINNWALFKGFIDRQDEIRNKFEKISLATHKLERALKQKNWGEAGKAIQLEWDTRKTLASGITTPEIDQAFAEASQLAPIAGKVCGAGGGGCFFVYLPLAEDQKLLTLKEEIKKIFLKRGMRHLPFRGAFQGLEVQLDQPFQPDTSQSSKISRTSDRKFLNLE